MSIVSGTAAVIKATIETVANRGNVYDYDPFPDGDWAEFVQKFAVTIGGSEVIRAWTIKNTHRDTVPLTISANSEVQRVHLTWLARFFVGHSEADNSDVTFRDLLEAVVETLNANRSLGHVEGAYDHDPADYDLPNNGALLSLGDVVCHYAEVTFISHHEIVVAVS